MLRRSLASRACNRVAPDAVETEASVAADDDEDQAAAQDGQTSNDEGKKASGNAIKVTHDTPLGSKGDGADQLIKTFGIPRGGDDRALRAFRRVWPCCAPGVNSRMESI